MLYALIVLAVIVAALTLSSVLLWRGLRAVIEGLLIVEDEHASLIALQGERILALEAFIETREPCGMCGHHRYRQKTLHRSDCK